jgi:hypothetical protein
MYGIEILLCAFVCEIAFDARLDAPELYEVQRLRTIPHKSLPDLATHLRIGVISHGVIICGA